MKHPTPTQYSFQDRIKYPQDNHIDFEYWLTQSIQNHEVPAGWTYLPITWTAYYKANGYGARINALQNYLNTLDRRKKYFTICQYDDGILNDVSHLSLRQYNMGAPGDYQLPLICQPHPYKWHGAKDIFCSFVGRITHPIRQAIVDQLSGKDGYYISTKPCKLDEFCQILARSRYVLAPRGYGMTSFRICEALQYGAAPIYISDVHLKPHGVNSYIEASPNNDFTQLKKTYDGEFADKLFGKFDAQQQINIYNQYYTYSANKELILKDLNKL